MFGILKTKTEKTEKQKAQRRFHPYGNVKSNLSPATAKFPKK